MNANSTTEASISATSKAECRSMTGYALVGGEFEGWAVRVSVKSVNHRFLDVKLRIPDSLEPYEHRLRQVVRARIHRGHVDVHVSMDPTDAAPVHVNRELLKAYLSAATELQKQTGGKGELDTVSLLRLPGVITGLASALPETEGGQEALGKMLETFLVEALAKMDEMRRNEGRHLTDELRARVAKIDEEAEQVRELVGRLRPAFSRRLEARLKELLNGTNIEPARLAQEAALLAERSDISEELDRLRSHLQQFTKLLDGAGELGKKLDFLLQEMHREANTMLSKTPGVESEALEITGLALEIKAEIEKLREQVQNIE
ncbi:MAG TPA: YicC/YloC family endoribonuclease [Candidatus Eremiobacteraceae bacterium]|nr:YicC/YloC family endoribonuclease [Candidatus Eremiobacteraceae bacterium]